MKTRYKYYEAGDFVCIGTLSVLASLTKTTQKNLKMFIYDKFDRTKIGKQLIEFSEEPVTDYQQQAKK